MADSLQAFDAMVTRLISDDSLERRCDMKAYDGYAAACRVALVRWEGQTPFHATNRRFRQTISVAT